MEGLAGDRVHLLVKHRLTGLADLNVVVAGT
jgi:hypothetical protein